MHENLLEDEDLQLERSQGEKYLKYLSLIIGQVNIIKNEAGF